MKPPTAAMMLTPEPDCRNTARTNGDLLRCYGEYQDSLRAANADKAAMQNATAWEGK